MPKPILDPHTVPPIYKNPTADPLSARDFQGIVLRADEALEDAEMNERDTEAADDWIREHMPDPDQFSLEDNEEEGHTQKYFFLRYRDSATVVQPLTVRTVSQWNALLYSPAVTTPWQGPNQLLESAASGPRSNGDLVRKVTRSVRASLIYPCRNCALMADEFTSGGSEYLFPLQDRW
jgi:hypothetical protein